MSSTEFESKQIEILSGSDVSEELYLPNATTAYLHMPSSLTGTAYTVEAWNPGTQSWSPARDSGGVAIPAITHVNSGSMRFPDSLCAAWTLRLKSNAVEAEDRAIYFDLKS